MLRMSMRACGLLAILLLLAGCPARPPDEITVEAAQKQIALLAGEQGVLEVTVRCSFAPCTPSLVVMAFPDLPAGLSLAGLDAPEMQQGGFEWRWRLSLSTTPTVDAYQGLLELSATVVERDEVPIQGASVELVAAPVPAAAPGPVARFAFAPTAPTVGQPIAFDASASTGRVTTWRWDFGADGSVEATGPLATYSFGVAGNWPVRLTVVDDAGAVDELTQTLVVGSGAADGEAVLTLSFTGAGSGGVTFTPAVTACSRDAEPVCSRRFAAGSTVVLRAFAYSGARLAGWGPGCSRISTAGDECDIVMDGNRGIELRID